MRAWLGRVFNIHPQDWKPLLLLQALIISVCTVIAAIKTVSNSLFVSNVGVSSLPYTYIASSLALVASGFLLIPLIDKLPRLHIYRITTLSLAGLFVLSFVAMLAHQTWVYYVAYLLANVADSILFLEFWLIAGDLCDSRQAKRVFPLVIGCSLVGGMIGTFGTKFLVGFVRTEVILLVSSGLLVSTLGLIALIARAFPRESAAVIPKVTFTLGKWPRMKLDFRIVQESRLVRLICASLILYSILAFLTDFVFNVVTVRHFTVNGDIQCDKLTAFFALFDGISISVSLVFQFFLVNRILRTIGITNAQLILPSALGLGFGSIFLSAFAVGRQLTFAAALGTRLGQKFLSSSIHRSSMAVLYSPIPSEKRGRSKAFAEGMIAPLGVFLAGVLILLVKTLPMVIVAAIATVFGIAYVLLMLRLRRIYLQAILKMFEDKNFGGLESFAGMFARLGEKEIMEKLCDCLADKDFNIRNFVVELLGEIKSKSAIEPLIDLYHGEENPTVKASIIKVVGGLGTPRIVPLLREAMRETDPRIRANAIEAVVASKNTELVDEIRRALDDSTPRVRTNAILALWNMKLEKDIPRAMEILFGQYEHGMVPEKLSALYAFGEIATEQCVDTLIQATRLADQRILSRAILSLGSTQSQAATKALIDLLPTVNTALQNLITASLIKLATTCNEIILQSLAHPDIYARRHLINVAATMDDARVPNLLKDMALSEIEAMHRHRDWQERIRTIRQQEVKVLFADTFEQLDRQAKENCLSILRVLAGNTPAIQRILKDLAHPNRFVRGAALDALEAVGHKTIAKAFVPILEEKSAATTREGTEPSSEELHGWVRQWLKSPYRWIRACGTFSVGKLGLETLQSELLTCLTDSYDLVRANAVEALAQFGLDSNRIYVQRMLNDPSPLPRRYAQELLT